MPPLPTGSLLLALSVACGGPEGSGSDSGESHVADSGTLPTESCDDRDPGTGMSPFDLEGDIECGTLTFRSECAGCHGQDGDGTADGPAIAEHVVSHTDEQLVFFILAGTGDMPAQELSPQESADVLAWLRDTFGPYNGEGH